MIIELERYNEIRALLIETGITGFLGHICYQDGGHTSVRESPLMVPLVAAIVCSQ